MAANGPGGAVSGPPSRNPPARLLAVVADLGQAVAAVLAGADLIELAAPDGQAAAVPALLRARCQGVLVCADEPGADLVRDPPIARATGARLICAGLAEAAACGLPAGQVIVQVTPGEVTMAAKAGWAALVDADAADAAAVAASGTDSDPAGLAGVVAAAALGCWLGAALVRTRHVRPVRRALDMTAVIRGTRPPARTLRGLA